MTQSLAIIEWLEELQPDPPLLPADPLGRAAVRSLALHVVSDDPPAHQPCACCSISGIGSGPGERELSAWQRHWMLEGLASLERRLARVAGTYAYGDTVTLADLCLVPQVYNARRYQLRPPAVPDHSPGGCGLPEAPGVRRGAARSGSPTRLRSGRRRASASASASNGNSTHSCRLLTAPTGANIASSGPGRRRRPRRPAAGAARPPPPGPPPRSAPAACRPTTDAAAWVRRQPRVRWARPRDPPRRQVEVDRDPIAAQRVVAR